jgi:hypothetical protein
MILRRVIDKSQENNCPKAIPAIEPMNLPQTSMASNRGDFEMKKRVPPSVTDFV